MEKFPRPRVLVSKCLGFAACRWNGLTVNDEWVGKLGRHVDFAPHCPEAEIGLGTPRKPLRIVTGSQGPRLVQPDTGRDATEAMLDYGRSLLGGLGVVDGFLLKNRSPSCGFLDVKHYSGAQPGANSRRGPGLFGGLVLEQFPHHPREDEGRLKNFTLREAFFTRLFTLADFRRVREDGEKGGLVEFQARNKLLLMGWSQARMRSLGRLAANPEKRPLEEIYGLYEAELRLALAQPPRSGSVINVLMHAMGYFSKELSAPEKALFLDSLESYRAGRTPLSAVLAVLRSWIARFREEYLAKQTFLNPYPEELVEITDSGKGRDY